MSPEDIASAKAWRTEDPPVTWKECARRLNYCANTLKRALNPAVREAHLKGNVRWYSDNVEGQHERNRGWQRANPDVCAARTIRYSNRKKAAPGNGYTSEQTTWLLENVFAGQCAYCARHAVELEWDHITPLSRGGSHHPENLIACCRMCNASKNDKLLLEWRDGAHLATAQLAVDVAALVSEVFGSEMTPPG